MERHTDPFDGDIFQIIKELQKITDYIEDETSPEFQELLIDAYKNNFSAESKGKIMGHADYEKHKYFLMHIGKRDKLSYLINRNKTLIEVLSAVARNDIAKRENWPDINYELPSTNDVLKEYAYKERQARQKNNY